VIHSWSVISSFCEFGKETILYWKITIGGSCIFGIGSRIHVDNGLTAG
jgi:hypothetical protein